MLVKTVYLLPPAVDQGVLRKNNSKCLSPGSWLTNY